MRKQTTVNTIDESIKGTNLKKNANALSTPRIVGLRVVFLHRVLGRSIQLIYFLRQTSYSDFIEIPIRGNVF